MVNAAKHSAPAALGRRGQSSAGWEVPGTGAPALLLPTWVPPGRDPGIDQADRVADPPRLPPPT